ncbi:MAG: hypothetical protein FWH17_01610 [Oscillospiraceae bacterium]|nr:hypothetical protein [Oscillospiraceae bacterium]
MTIRILTIMLAFAVVLLLCACSPNALDSIAHKGIDAKTVSFDSLEEMEDFSSLIVIGVRMDDDETILLSEEGRVYGGFTYSNFKITKIFKDKTETVKENDIITILENEFYDSEQRTVFHLAGYNMMVEGNEYLLFLDKAKYNGKDYYVSSGVNFGTVSLQDDNRTIARFNERGNEVSNFSYFEEIWQQALDKYKIS